MKLHPDYHYWPLLVWRISGSQGQRDVDSRHLRRYLQHLSRINRHSSRLAFGGSVIALLITVIYILCLGGLLIYSLVELHLSWLHRRLARVTDTILTESDDRDLPAITVQLPLYNERHVAQRLIDAVSQSDYPQDKLEIHVLDDSTDDTPVLVQQTLSQLAARGFHVAHVRRTARDGFKAGALRDGLAEASSAFVAIFDADFCPAPDMLRKSIAHFADPRVAVVQLRWAFLNERYSVLTRLQAFLLGAHFRLEQPARSMGHLFANFNGTAGIWRRSAIDDAGGWRADTLTEDLDLSYRAQLKGWRIVYLEHQTCDCELPVDMDGFRSQQYRWMKGGAENARLHLVRILRSTQPWRVKLHACTHLLASSLYVLTVGAILSGITLGFMDHSALDAVGVRYGWPLLLTSLALWAVFYEAHRPRGLFGLARFSVTMTGFFALSLAISLHNATAAVSGWLGLRSEFVRTPKYGVVGEHGDWANTDYASRKVASLVWAEIALLIAAASSLASGWQRGDFTFFALEVPLVVGLTGTIGLSLLHVARARLNVAPRLQGSSATPTR